MTDPGITQPRAARSGNSLRAGPRRPAGRGSRTRSHRALGDVPASGGRRSVLERTVLATLSTLVSVNLWTGGPLLAVWVGSRIQAASGQLSMSAVAGTVVVLVVETLILYRILLVLNARYNTVLGRRERRYQAPWLKPMTGERRVLEVKRPLTGVERAVVVSVVLAALAIEIWFFFFAHYSLAH